MENDNEDLAARVADIEKTIGDIAEMLGSLKSALASIPQPPNCPPYCSHLDAAAHEEYEDEMSLADRVADIRKCIGDTGTVFGALIDALGTMPLPNCPPYCGHSPAREE